MHTLPDPDRCSPMRPELAAALIDTLLESAQPHGTAACAVQRTWTTHADPAHLVVRLARLQPTALHLLCGALASEVPALGTLRDPAADPWLAFGALIRRPVAVGGWVYTLSRGRPARYAPVQAPSERLVIHALQEARHPDLGAWCQAAAQFVVDHAMTPLGILPAACRRPYLVIGDRRDFRRQDILAYFDPRPLKAQGGRPVGDGHVAVTSEPMAAPCRLGVLAHELVHAAQPVGTGHSRRFALACVRLGLSFADRGADSAGIFEGTAAPWWAKAAYEHAGAVPWTPDPCPGRLGSRSAVRPVGLAYEIVLPGRSDP